MNSQIKQILRLNKKFYQSVSKDFSNSRQSAWKGWDRAIRFSLRTKGDTKKSIKILDIGCGNGRFAEYVAGKLKKFSYTGYDTNNDLLSEAKTKYKSTSDIKVKFVKRDVISGISKIKASYNLVVGFGFTHHIPDKNFRVEWFSSLTRVLKRDGVLVLTFWDFEKSPGDYLIGWDNKSAVRYCHQYSNKELMEIQNILAKKGLILLDKFRDDNKNIYLIFGNI